MIPLPKQTKNSQSGQILIIFLLILVVGLAIVLSIASRTVTDVRQTTTSDESNRAYYAAESGVENALKKISDGTINPAVGGSANVSLTNVNNSSANVNVVPITISSSQVFEFPGQIVKDDVSQISLISDFNIEARIGDTGSGSFADNDGLNIYFSTDSAVKPSVEVSVVTKTSGGTWGIYKFAYNADTTLNGSNHFCTASGSNYGPFTKQDGSPSPQSPLTFKYLARVRFASGTTDCSGASSNNDSVPAGAHPVLARIRLLYNTNPVTLAVQGTNSAGTARALPNQGSIITSIGTTPSGVTRKLTVTRLYPALPAIFDYVLYNGSATNPLSKP